MKMLEWDFGRLPPSIMIRTTRNVRGVYKSVAWLSFAEYFFSIINRTGKPNIPIYAVDKITITQYFSLRKHKSLFPNIETVSELLLMSGVAKFNSWTQWPRVEIRSQFRRGNSGMTVRLYIDENHPGNRGLHLNECGALISVSS